PWLAAMLNYCSRCGTELTFGPIEGEDRDRLGCPSCGHIAYVNPRLVVTTIPVTDAGEVVLLRRGIEPGRGWWAQPGGFLEVDETVGEAAVRETLEVRAFSPDAIPWPGIAFKTSYWAIRDWLHRRRPDIHPADRHWDE